MSFLPGPKPPVVEGSTARFLVPFETEQNTTEEHSHNQGNGLVTQPSSDCMVLLKAKKEQRGEQKIRYATGSIAKLPVSWAA